MTRILNSIDEGFDETFRPSWSASERCLEPLIEIESRENDFVVTVDLPCVDRKDIHLQISEESVELKAEFKQSLKWERWGAIQKRLEFFSFKKTIKLPDTVDPQASKASFKQGILRIILPKSRKRFIIEVK